MCKWIIVLFGIHIISTTIIFSQSLTSRLDSIYNRNPEEKVFLHSLLSFENSNAEKRKDGFECKIYLISSIAYFLLFDVYDQKSYKTQILEKGLDRLKIAIKLIDSSANSISKFSELYDELFNFYYTYKTGTIIPDSNIESLLIDYSSHLADNEIINWFQNKFWRDKCSKK